jgi:hypothetical protein
VGGILKRLKGGWGVEYNGLERLVAVAIVSKQLVANSQQGDGGGGEA